PSNVTGGGGPLGPPCAGSGGLGLLAGSSALRLNFTVPSADRVKAGRASSGALKLTVWKLRFQVTVPPTGIETSLGANAIPPAGNKWSLGRRISAETSPGLAPVPALSATGLSLLMNPSSFFCPALVTSAGLSAFWPLATTVSLPRISGPWTRQTHW